MGQVTQAEWNRVMGLPAGAGRRAVHAEITVAGRSRVTTSLWSPQLTEAEVMREVRFPDGRVKEGFPEEYTR